MDQGIFAKVVDGPSPTGRKEPWQLFSPQLILQWGTYVYFKETIIFPESKQGGGGVSKMSGGPTFSKVMGPNCFFLLNLLLSRGFRTPCTPSGFAHCLSARVYVCGLLKSPKTKHAVSSSKA